MGEPFLGEIRMFGGNFAPLGWAFCAGQRLAIAENDALFTLIGTTYGGDGRETFALPDLRGRAPVHTGAGPGGTARGIGETGGAATVTLTAGQVAGHGHALHASTDAGSQPKPAGNVLATPPVVQLYATAPPDATLAAAAVQPTGGSQPHDNRQPYLAISFIIALTGIFPSQD